MTRYGYVMRLRGDQEIASALADGIERGTAAASPKVLEADAVAREWLDQQRLRRAVGNHRTPEDYALMTVKARGNYTPRRPGPVRTVWLQMIGLFALFLDWEEKCWRGEA